MSRPLRIPAPRGYSQPPIWTGSGFLLDEAFYRIVSYTPAPSGWTDELTGIHEEIDDEGHYINVASREHATSRLRKWLHVEAPILLDIGCSSGYMIRSLRRTFPRANILGADCVRGPLEQLAVHMPDLPLLEFNLVECPLPDESVDGVVLLNVLEHIEDDKLAIRQVYRVLSSGGIAVIEVPSGPHLYDIYDRQLMHYRRYRMRDLQRLCEAAGFETLERSHLGFFLYPAFSFVKRRNQRLRYEHETVQKAVVSANMRQMQCSLIMRGIMRIEAILRNILYYPVGIRCLIVCKRP